MFVFSVTGILHLGSPVVSLSSLLDRKDRCLRTQDNWKDPTLAILHVGTIEENKEGERGREMNERECSSHPD